MHYQNTIDFCHDLPTMVGVLMVNMGTPNAPEVTDVRRYLKEFLSDPRIVELPRSLWWLILHGLILPLRPRRSAKAYQRIWEQGESPLLRISQRQAMALQEQLSQQGHNAVRVVLAMRYGTPSIAAGLAVLRKTGARHILILPMYPQYSATTTGSVFDAVTSELQRWRWIPELRFINQYHDNPGYIEALTHSIRRYWQEHGEPQRLLISFHGIPKSYFLAGDPYYCHCLKTARLIAADLQLVDERWQVAFQSRVGPREWLTPYTDQQLQEWGRSGIEKVQVLCPGFSADCLETLDEIALENRHHFLAAGGKDYGYIPALNDDIKHMAAITALVNQHLCGWPTTISYTSDCAHMARKLGAAC